MAARWTAGEVEEIVKKKEEEVQSSDNLTCITWRLVGSGGLVLLKILEKLSVTFICRIF